MTSVNVTAVTSTVTVTEGDAGTTVVTVPETSVVTAVAVGPQGPIGPQGASGLIVDTTAKVNKSVVYYDAHTSSFKADATWTTTTIVDGANF